MNAFGFFLGICYVVCVVANNPPRVVNSVRLLIVPENLPVGSSISNIFTEDLDGDLLTFTIVPALKSGTVTLPADYYLKVTPSGPAGSQKAEITLKNKLDREAFDRLLFSVLLSDGKSSGNVRSPTMTLLILDANDNAPIFTDFPRDVTVSRDSPVGSTIFTGVSVVDPDLAEIFTFSLQTDSCDVFKVNSTTGTITLAKPLDTIRTDRCYLYLVVKDNNAIHNTTAYLTVSLTGTYGGSKKQNSPPRVTEYLPQKITTKPEDSPVGSFLFSVTTADAENDTVEFTIVPHSRDCKQVASPADYYMQVESRGSPGSQTALITLKNKLDRETYEDLFFTILVNDGKPNGVTFSAVMVLAVDDVNDNAPLFTNTPYIVTVSESTPVGSVIFCGATVTDRDRSDTHTFRLSQSNSFTIDKTTGTVTLARALNYKERSRHEVQLIVEDSNGKHSGSAFLTVTVKSA